MNSQLQNLLTACPNISGNDPPNWELDSTPYPTFSECKVLVKRENQKMSNPLRWRCVVFSRSARAAFSLNLLILLACKKRWHRSGTYVQHTSLPKRITTRCVWDCVKHIRNTSNRPVLRLSPHTFAKLPPSVHQPPPLLQKIASPVCRLNLVFDCVG
jgi:hypothetical protein